MANVETSSESLQGRESKCSSTMQPFNLIPSKGTTSKSSIPRMQQHKPVTSKSFAKEKIGSKNTTKGLRSKSCAENYFKNRRAEMSYAHDKGYESDKNLKRIPRPTSLSRHSSNLSESSETHHLALSESTSRELQEPKAFLSEIDNTSCSTIASKQSHIVNIEYSSQDMILPVKKGSNVLPVVLKITSRPTLIKNLSIESNISNSSKNTPINNEKNFYEKLYAGKIKAFNSSKAEIYEKQKQLMSLYKDLKNTKHKIEEKTGKTLPWEELKIIVPQILDKKSNDTIIEKPAIEEMEASLKQITDCYLDQCRKLLNKRIEILDFLLKDPIAKNVTIARQLDIFRKENVDLEIKIKNMQKDLDEKAKVIINQWIRLHRVASMEEEKIVHEIQKETDAVLAKLNSTIEELDKTKRQKNDLEKKYSDAIKTIEEKRKTIESLGSENEKKKDIAPIIQANNTKLKFAKQRVRELESKNKEQEQRMELLNVKIKRLEEQWRTQETIFETRTQEVLKSAMLKESVVNRIEKHKTNVEIRVKELEHILEETINNYTTQIKDLQDNCDMAHKEMMICNVEKVLNENKFNEIRNRLVEMEIKQLESDELAKMNQIVGFGVKKGNALTQTELELWTELQTTRRALKKTEEELNKKKEEKALFMETIENTITWENLENNETFVAKMIKKDEKINYLQNRLENLSDAIILSQNLASKQAKKIDELKRNIEVLMNSSGNGDVYGLEQEQKEKLEKALKKNNDLEQKLIVKERALKISENRLQHLGNLLKVRDGVIGIMKSKKDITDSEYYKTYVNDLISQYNEVNIKLTQKNEQVDQLNLKMESEKAQMVRLKKNFKSLETLVQETSSQNNEFQEKLLLYHKLLKDNTADKLKKL